MIASMATALPASYRCIASRDVGEPQRSMLLYFAEVAVQREGAARRSGECDLLLIQGTAHEERSPGAEWIRIWDGARPGDKTERFRLYRRIVLPGAVVR
jgi:hypothetical protein